MRRRLFSIVTIILFSFAFQWARGGPVTTKIRIKNPRPFIPIKSSRPAIIKISKPLHDSDIPQDTKDNVVSILLNLGLKRHTFLNSGQEKTLKPFTLLLCAHRMLCPDMGMKWIGDWPVQPQNLRSHVTECVTLVLPLVQGRANWVLAKPPHTWNKKLFVQNLCKHRCYDRNFGGIQFNGRWPSVSDRAGATKCRAECKAVYKSLLNKVMKVQSESDENVQVTKAVGVVRGTIKQRELRMAAKGIVRTKGPKGGEQESLRVQLFRSQLRNKKAIKS
ncbi:hypothetical protein F5887DRAFT_982379 [Amanita rubescens]|nr:hypothetical protein F5887DRAFT_982379 [Amanita rubescens]